MTSKKIDMKWEFSAALAVVFAAALLLYFVVAGLTREKMGDVGSFMSGVFGSAVALAGAFVAVKLASIAVRLQEDQQRRDDVKTHFEMLNTTSSNLSEALASTLGMVKGIQDMHEASTFCYQHSVEYVQHRTADAELATTMNQIKQSLTEMRAASARFRTSASNVAQECRANRALSNPVSAFLLNILGGKKFQYDEFTVCIADSQLWAGIFEKASGTLGYLNSLDDDAFVKRVVNSRRAAQLLVDHADNKFNNVSVRNFVFMSFLCSGSLEFSNHVVNIIDHLPSGEEMNAAVKELLPDDLHMSPGLEHAIRNFDLSRSLDPSLIFALQAYKTIGPKLPSMGADATREGASSGNS